MAVIAELLDADLEESGAGASLYAAEAELITRRSSSWRGLASLIVAGPGRQMPWQPDHLTR
jgi:hypothetical protein